MCRAGGRRCPSHSNPLKVAEYNAVRRERYAAQKTDGFGSFLEKSNPVIDKLNGALKQDKTGTVAFPDFSYKKPYMDGRWSGGGAGEYRKAAQALYQRVKKLDSKQKDKKAFEITNPKTFAPSFVMGIYTTAGYIEMREYLNRDNQKFLSKLVAKKGRHDDELKVFKQKIDSVMEKVEPPTEPRLLYRGMVIKSVDDVNEIPAYLEKNFPVGGVISQKNYMSTTLTAGIAVGKFSGDSELDQERSVVFEILSKQGAPLGEGLSMFSYDEAEVLMPRDAKFKVVSVDRDVNYVYESGQRNKTTAKKTVIRLIDVSEDK